MKLTETIDACIKLVIYEIESCDFYINECKDVKGATTLTKEERKTWLEHLQNLKYIKYETQLDEYDELIERDK
jgi:hypothetical protein